jgi:RNA polymerase sigma factor for flagellar operon FliA
MDVGAMVTGYLPLVSAIARAMSRGLPSCVEIDDLVNDGVIGLMTAVRRYDPGRGVEFSAYAGHRIRGAILDGLRARDPLPRALRKARKARATSPAPASEGPGLQLVELDCAAATPADEDAGPEALALEADLRRRLRQGLAILPPRDRQVLLLRMVHGLPLRAVAQHLSLSVTRTMEIQARGIARLRRHLDGEPMTRPGQEGAGRLTNRMTTADRTRPASSPGAARG